MLFFYKSPAGVLIVLTQHFYLTLCQRDTPRSEYTSDRKYYNVSQGLTDIPAGIPSDALQVTVTFNPITKIRTNAFSELTECRELNLWRNEISEIESGSFNGLQVLTKLNLEGNLLQGLYPNMFADLENCQYLDLQINVINQIESGSFDGLVSIWSVILQDNQMTGLQSGMFQGLDTIRSLYLQNNAITSISDKTFENLNNLTTLWLSNNDLTQLNPGALSGLESLETLRLEGNQLTELSSDVLKQLPRPLYLSMHDVQTTRASDNPLVCDSHLCWLRKEDLEGEIIWFVHVGVAGERYQYSPRCADGTTDFTTWNCTFPGKNTNMNRNKLRSSYRLGPVNSKSFIGKVFLRIKWKFERLK